MVSVLARLAAGGDVPDGPGPLLAAAARATVRPRCNWLGRPLAPQPLGGYVAAEDVRALQTAAKGLYDREAALRATKERLEEGDFAAELGL